MRRPHKVGLLPDKMPALLVADSSLASLLAVGSGLICSPTTTNRRRLVPGGSQVIRVAVAVWPGHRIEHFHLIGFNDLLVDDLIDIYFAICK